MFIAKDYPLSNYVRIHNYFVGFFGRKDFLKRFCLRNGIDYKPIKEKKYLLPREFLIEHRELSFLNGVRNKVLISFYDDYKEVQLENLKEQKMKKSEIEQQKSIIEEVEKQLEYYKAQLKEAKQKKIKINIIHFESLSISTKTRIKNENERAIALEREKEQLEKEYIVNKDNWIKQIETLEDTFNNQKLRFEENISKKVRKTLNYTDFKSDLGDYNESVKKIIKGEVYEEE